MLDVICKLLDMNGGELTFIAEIIGVCGDYRIYGKFNCNSKPYVTYIHWPNMDMAKKTIIQNKLMSPHIYAYQDSR